MDINRKNLDELFRAYNKVFQDAMASFPGSWQKFASTVTSASASNVYPYTEQIYGMREWIGDRQIKNLIARKFQVVNRDFEDTVSIARNDIEDDQLGMYPAQIAGLGANSAAVWYDLAVEALVSALTGTWTIDGGDFFSNSRVYGDSQIVNGTTAALSSEAYGTARGAMMAYAGHNGKPLRVTPNLLLVGPSLEATAFGILKDRFLAKGAVQADNPWLGSADYQVLPELTGANAGKWFLADTTKPFKPVVIQQRKLPVLTSLDGEKDENVFMRKTFIYGADARGEAFLPFPHLIYAGGLGSVKGLEKGGPKEPKGDGSKGGKKD